MSQHLPLQKVIACLPGSLDKDTLYFVRVGRGFNIYLSDMTGRSAHKLNPPEPSEIREAFPDYFSTANHVQSSEIENGLSCYLTAGDWELSYSLTLRSQADLNTEILLSVGSEIQDVSYVNLPAGKILTFKGVHKVRIPTPVFVTVSCAAEIVHENAGYSNLSKFRATKI